MVRGSRRPSPWAAACPSHRQWHWWEKYIHDYGEETRICIQLNEKYRSLNLPGLCTFRSLRSPNSYIYRRITSIWGKAGWGTANNINKVGNLVIFFDTAVPCFYQLAFLDFISSFIPLLFMY